jgi:hypothetical protein
MKDKWYIKKNNGDNFVYHCFTFDPKIQEHTFLGNEFIGMDQQNEGQDIFRSYERVVEAGPEGFMPELVKELKDIFGEGNYKYDGYEIGEDETSVFEFNLYFLIKEKLYKLLLKKVEKWSEYHGFRELISWEENEVP